MTLPIFEQPWVAPAAVAAAGLGLGIGLGMAAARRWPPLPPADCRGVGTGGGTVAGVRYLEQMRGGASPDEKVPMVILFHSRGGTPEGYINMHKGIGRARVIAPEGDFNKKWWDLGIKAAMRDDNLDGATGEWTYQAARMRRFIQEIIQCRPTLGKPVLSGNSQGGEMVLLMGSESPELVDSGVAVSSYLIPTFWTTRMAPVRMIHGTGDRTVPYEWALNYFQNMQPKGAPLGFQAYESDGHAVTKEMSRDWGATVKGRVEAITATA